MTATEENAKTLPLTGDRAADIPVERVRAELAGLRKGAGIEERGEYGLKLTVNRAAAMRPHYLFVPEYPCELFDLTVRFDPALPPAWVRAVDGEQVRVFDAAVPPARSLRLSDSGEVRVTFTRLRLNLGYGLQWQP